jgi:hypothetical protein
MEKNTTQTDIKRLSESLSHGEIDGSGTLFTPYMSVLSETLIIDREGAECFGIIFVFCQDVLTQSGLFFIERDKTIGLLR